MTEFDPQAAASALLAARAAGRPAGPLGDLAPRDLTQAAAVQVALARLTNAWPPGGFKIGATGRRMQALLGLPGPAAGFMAARNVHPGETTLSLAGLRGPGVECELAVRLSRDLPPGHYTEQDVAAYVGTLAAAIELVENRYGPPPIGDLAAVGTPTLVADQVYHVAALLGPELAAWQDFDLAALEGVLSIDGFERDRGFGRELLGHPLRGLAWLAGSEVVAAFSGLRAGQVVMLGSVVPTLRLDGTGPGTGTGAIVTADFVGLPSATLRLSHAAQAGVNPESPR